MYLHPHCHHYHHQFNSHGPLLSPGCPQVHRARAQWTQLQRDLPRQVRQVKRSKPSKIEIWIDLNCSGKPHNPMLNAGAIMSCSLMLQVEYFVLHFEIVPSFCYWLRTSKVKLILIYITDNLKDNSINNNKIQNTSYPSADWASKQPGWQVWLPPAVHPGLWS